MTTDRADQVTYVGEERLAKSTLHSSTKVFVGPTR